MVSKSTVAEPNKAPDVLGASQIPLDLIVEDPTQPRKVFDLDSLAELTETIKARGVKTPISVRPNPDKSGTYIINHGARRYRASKSAGLTSIPAYIDTDYSLADQVVENLQRDNLTSREIVDYIGREIASGKNHTQISKLIGKSTAYVSLHVAAMDLPDPIAELFNSGALTDITTIYNLNKTFKKYPLELTDWLNYSKPEDLTRSKVQQFRKFLESRDDEIGIMTALTRQAPTFPSDFTETSANNKSNKYKLDADDLLTYIYVRLKKRTHQPQDIMKKLSNAQKTTIIEALQKYYAAGLKCKDLFHAILNSLKEGEFDGAGRGAFNLTAFFFGVNKKEFDLEKIIHEVSLNLDK